MKHDIEHRTLPASLYRDAEIYRQERSRIFGRSWHFIGHEEQLAEHGAYLATEVAGFPLLAVRGDDGVIRVFHNVCRHRAGPLVGDGSGVCRGELVCRYHGWRYTLDGRLRVARDFGPAPGFDPREYGLVALRTASWRGFVFANMDSEASDLSELTAPLDRRLGDIPIDNYRFQAHTVHDLKCNWKTYAENYLEGYHIPLIHPELTDAIECSRYEIEVDPPCVFHRAPPRDGTPVNGVWALVWPSLAINTYRHGVMMERISPVGHSRTRLDYYFYFSPDLPRTEIERALATSAILVAEDASICEAVQRNLDAGAYDTGRLSARHEGGVAWFQQVVRQRLAE